MTCIPQPTRLDVTLPNTSYTNKATKVYVLRRQNSRTSKCMYKPIRRKISDIDSYREDCALLIDQVTTTKHSRTGPPLASFATPTNKLQTYSMSELLGNTFYRCIYNKYYKTCFSWDTVLPTKPHSHFRHKPSTSSYRVYCSHTNDPHS